MIIEGHLQVETDEFGQMAVSVWILGAEDRANSKNLPKTDRNCNIFYVFFFSIVTFSKSAAIAICLYNCGLCARYAEPVRQEKIMTFWFNVARFYIYP